MFSTMQKLKGPIIGVVIVIILVVGYMAFFKKDGTEGDKLQVAKQTNTTAPDEQAFLSLLLRIQNITINTAIFSDPVFNTLQDDGLAIVDQPHGRRNPFSPIGSDNGAPVGTTTQAR
jgi:hypothetical protein